MTQIPNILMSLAHLRKHPYLSPFSPVSHEGKTDPHLAHLRRGTIYRDTLSLMTQIPNIYTHVFGPSQETLISSFFPTCYEG